MASNGTIKNYERRIKARIKSLREVIDAWKDSHPSKKSALERVNELEKRCKEYSGTDRILDIDLPTVSGTNVIWKITNH